jgi:hypothetical protein
LFHKEITFGGAFLGGELFRVLRFSSSSFFFLSREEKKNVRRGWKRTSKTTREKTKRENAILFWIEKRQSEGRKPKTV